MQWSCSSSYNSFIKTGMIESAWLASTEEANNIKGLLEAEEDTRKVKCKCNANDHQKTQNPCDGRDRLGRCILMDSWGIGGEIFCPEWV